MSVKKENQRTLVWSLVVGAITMAWIVWMSFYEQAEFNGILPARMSTRAANTDWVFYFIYYWSIIFFIGVVGAMVYFMIKHLRKDDAERTEKVKDSVRFELFWVIFPTLLVVVVFFLGARDYVDHRVVPPNAYTVQVEAWQWGWQFTYPNGKTSDSLVVPAARPVKMRMKSRDVLHSFFIPRFRVKQDLMPNRYTFLWFQADDPTDTTPVTDANMISASDGIYQIKDGNGERRVIPPHDLYCTEYCGLSHSNMNRKVHVLSQAAFDEWVADVGEVEVSVATGKAIYDVQCAMCHSLDGSAVIGPSWQGLYGANRRFTDGTSAVADENYIRSSIVNPNLQVVEGYAPAMPAFEGILNDAQIESIILYLQSLEE